MLAEFSLSYRIRAIYRLSAIRRAFIIGTVETRQLTDEQRAIVAEFGPLYNESQLWARKQRRLDGLRDVIRSWYPDLAADQATTAVGTGWEIQVGEKPIEKNWKSMAAVYKAAGGLKPFLKLCSVTFKALSALLGQSAAPALQIEARTGHRKIKAVAILPPAVELPKAA